MADIGEVDVRNLYSDDYFSGGQGEYPDYLSEKELLIRRGMIYAGLVSRFTGKPGRLLDVGSAAGFILKGFIDSGWQGEGLEPNGSMVNYGQTHFHLDLHQGTLESFRPTDDYDLICLIQVIAHFQDPIRAVRTCFSMLKGGGHLLVETWNWRSLTARLFGRLWHEYNPPYVIQWFSKDSLHHLLTHEGYRLTGGGRPGKKISGRHAKFLIDHKLTGSPGGHTVSQTGPMKRLVSRVVNLLPDEMVIPYLGGDLFWTIYRKPP